MAPCRRRIITWVEISGAQRFYDEFFFVQDEATSFNTSTLCDNAQNVTKGDSGPKAVITAPLSLESEESDSKYRAPNIIQRVLSLLTNLPPQFNIPKSQLQCYGESVYCVGSDMLSKCADEETCLSRFVSVVAWSISTVRPLAFGVAPYNPILGETHHVSRGALNVLLEQVSHHPPVTALQATDEKDSIELLCCQSPVPRFYGTHIETEVAGKRQLKLLDKNETYTLNSPKLVIRFLPVPRVDWLGNVNVRCPESGLEAELSYRGNSFLPRPSVHRSIKGKIFLSSTSQTIYEIDGHWDRTVTAKDVSTGKTTIVYNAKEALSGLKTPFVKDPEAILESESTVVWGEVTRAILQKSWDKAREAKTCIEEWQREIGRERKSKDDVFAPKYFTLSHTKENGWDCLPINKLVPKAPILVD
ncbi:oxysterol-binding protein-related protein 4c [Phtheirospermum japonicum]|uniref:Oxysterol-binding protein-related protein 4c n=1 Tax=Phtheirospermum japonicum TaxID=374723 RepID=A0A830BT56_9LAMI|nr:oxysterol-binding protein-related protein 4c [Phtheirospermum japonicum]